MIHHILAISPGILTTPTWNFADEWRRIIADYSPSTYVVECEEFVGFSPQYNWFIKNPLAARRWVEEIVAAQTTCAAERDCSQHVLERGCVADQPHQLNGYSGWSSTQPRSAQPHCSHIPISFIAHSNGTHRALLAAQLLAQRGVLVENIVLLGSVLHDEVGKNGLLDLVQSGSVSRCFAYYSESDEWVGLGARPGLASLLPYWPYGRLGLHGFRKAGECYGALLLNNTETDDVPFLTSDPVSAFISRHCPGYQHGDYLRGSKAVLQQALHDALYPEIPF